MIIKLLVEGGEMKPSPVIGQKLGPLGINIGKVISEVNNATSSFKGIKVPVELDVDSKTKNFSVNVFSPPTSELIKKELEIEKASGQHKKIKVGNLAIEQVIKIAKTKYSNMLAGNFKSAVKSIVGSCISLGVLIENKEAKEVTDEINQGKYDKEINSEKTEVDAAKKKEISEFFSKLKDKQEALLKKEEELKKAEEEKAAKPEEKKEEKAEEKEEKKDKKDKKDEKTAEVKKK